MNFDLSNNFQSSLYLYIQIKILCRYHSRDLSCNWVNIFYANITYYKLLLSSHMIRMNHSMILIVLVTLDNCRDDSNRVLQWFHFGI